MQSYVVFFLWQNDQKKALKSFDVHMVILMLQRGASTEADDLMFFFHYDIDLQ